MQRDIGRKKVDPSKQIRKSKFHQKSTPMRIEDQLKPRANPSLAKLPETAKIQASASLTFWGALGGKGNLALTARLLLDQLLVDASQPRPLFKKIQQGIPTIFSQRARSKTRDGFRILTSIRFDTNQSLRPATIPRDLENACPAGELRPREGEFS